MLLLVSFRRGPEPGRTVIRLQRASSGAMGGMIDVSRTTKNLTAAPEPAGRDDPAAGVLVGVAQG
jgi:hypothetical protein